MVIIDSAFRRLAISPKVPSISIILPTYNERENIGPLIQQIYQTMGEEAEVIVVDDDSPDGTWAVIEGMTAAHSNLRLIRRKKERGLVSALNEGISRSTADVVAWLDCDLSMPPAKIKELYEAVLQGYDVVIGSRFVDGGGVEIVTGSQDTPLAFFMSSLLNSFIQRVLGPQVKDYTSGFVAVRRRVLENIRLTGDYGEYFIELACRAHRNGYRLLEIPYISSARRKGTSKTGTHVCHYLRRGSKYVWRTLKLKLSAGSSIKTEET